MLRKVFSHHIFLALLALIFIFNVPSVYSVEPLPLLSLRIKPNLAQSSCLYSVEITTSCPSVPATRDQIGLAFGDAFGNQVHVPRIDDRSSGRFRACATDTINIRGPCTHDVCYLALHRRGNDGWSVDTVRVSGTSTRPITFIYNSWIPNDVWFGFNICNRASAYPIL